LQDNTFDFGEYSGIFALISLDEFKHPNYQIRFTPEEENIGQFIDVNGGD
jgi:hypothetical protein